VDCSLYETPPLCYNQSRMNIVWTVGDLVRKLRGEMTQEELADRAGLNKATVNRYEMRSARAEQSTGEKIAKVFGTTTHDLGLYVEALNLANQFAQLGVSGKVRVKQFLDERLRGEKLEPPRVPGPVRGSPSPAKPSNGSSRGTARKPRGASR
jgi:DNA-binding XRE family transcriptional regulator